MAESIPLKPKLMKILFGLGVRGLGPSLVRELPRRSNEWTELVLSLFASEKDIDAREAALAILTSRGFLERHPAKNRFIPLLVELMQKGIGKERHQVVRFVGQNLQLFPTDGDAFRLPVIGLQRSGDPELANAADAILEKIGVDMRDPSLFQQGE